MEMRYYKEYSSALQRDMECKVYGHAGPLCCSFPARTAASSILKTTV